MNLIKLLGLALLPLLIGPSIALAQPYIAPPPQPNTYFLPINVSMPSPGYIVIISSDYHNFSIYVFTPSEYDSWYNQNSVSAVYMGSISYGGILTVPVNAGNYVVVIYPIPSANYEANVYVNTYPVGLPMGASSYPESPIRSSEVMGYFMVKSLSAYNPTGRSEYQVPNGGASLQLNAVICATLDNGEEQEYWVQDVIQFDTSDNTLYVTDNVWNYTVPGGNMSSSVVSGYGYVNYTQTVNEYYYWYSTGPLTYSLPMAGYLVMRTWVYEGVIYMEFGYVLIEIGGSYQQPNVDWFDLVEVRPYEPATSAHFVAYINQTGSGNVMDVEFVFGGYGNGEWTSLNSLSAELALVYWNGSSWNAFPRMYDFGVDTAESVSNAYVVMSGTYARITTGPENPGILSASPGMPFLPMTYVSYINTVTGVSVSEYVRNTTTITIPTVVPINDDERYALAGYYLNNEFVSNDSITISPSSIWFTSYMIEPNYVIQYLVNVYSPIPITVNGEEAINYTAWLEAGSVLNITTSVHVFSNGTMLVPVMGNETLIINEPITLSVAWTPYYLVNVVGERPIIINGTTLTRYTGWVKRGEILVIKAPTYSEYGGLVQLVPNTTSIMLMVEGPTTIVISYRPNYGILAITSLVVIAALFTFVLWRVKRRIGSQ